MKKIHIHKFKEKRILKMKNINERYTHKELRSIYKDAKYNWPNNCEPMYLAVDEENNNDGIYIIKINGNVKICCHSKRKA